MTAQQHFWDSFYAWCLVLGFVLRYITLSNPFGPLIRWIDRWQVHRLEIAKIKARTKLTRHTDPEYVEFLERKTRGEESS
jgi:hypothetical protein